jgi:hypothetical protein
MFAARWQYTTNVKIADVYIVEFLSFFPNTAFEYVDLCTGVWREEEREGVSRLTSLIANTMHCGRKPTIGLPFQVLPDVANKRSWLRWRADPNPILVENLKSRDPILKHQCKP